MLTQIRDPVHGFVTFRDQELKIIGTRALQRTRGIRQLALATLVYPGAIHTRFDHTLGVTHVAGLMVDALGLKDDDAKDFIRYAALLHDIGHGPFSHVSEHLLERYADRNSLQPCQKKEKIHELVTSLMINNDNQIRDILGRQTCEKITKLLSSGYGEPAFRSIISGPLDADKQDYLLRDSYFCGVQYGVFDKHQFHRSLVAYGKNNERELMIKPDGVHALEQYVLAKYYLTANVYRHKVRLITDQMIIRAIVLGIEKDNIDELKQLYSFDNTWQFAERYAQWDDSRFLITFGPNYAGDTKCKLLLSRLRERNLFKRIFSANPKDFKADVRESLLEIAKPHMDTTRKKIEANIKEIISQAINQEVDSDFVIYHAFDIEGVKEMSRNDEAKILVAKQPEPVYFDSESSLFASIQEGFNEIFVEVYAPVTWETRSERNKICDNLRSKIMETIESHCSESEQIRQGDPR